VSQTNHKRRPTCGLHKTNPMCLFNTRFSITKTFFLFVRYGSIVVSQRTTKHTHVHTPLRCTLDLELSTTIHIRLQDIYEDTASLATGASPPLVVHRRLRSLQRESEGKTPVGNQCRVRLAHRPVGRQPPVSTTRATRNEDGFEPMWVHELPPS